VARFLIDENLPRSLASHLRDLGFEAADVRDVGLRGHSDPEVLAYAVEQGLVLLSGDLGFASLIRERPRPAGLVLARLPNEWPVWAVNELIGKALAGLQDQGRELTGQIVVLEPDRLRIRALE
jgi:predicted nuclease of predicted toxin-antitoxin system